MKFLKDIFVGNFPIVQRFGENPAIYNPMGLAGHNGIDFATPIGTIIMPGCKGEIIAVSDDGKKGYGKSVVIKTSSGGFIYELRWAHLSAFGPSQRVGDSVDVDDTLGATGNTGFCVHNGHLVTDAEREQGLGAHLHFQIREMDEHGQILNWSQWPDNARGFKGAIDPIDFFDL